MELGYPEETRLRGLVERNETRRLATTGIISFSPSNFVEGAFWKDENVCFTKR